VERPPAQKSAGERVRSTGNLNVGIRPASRAMCELSRCRLFRCGHKHGTGQLAVFTGERCVVGVVVSTKKGRWPGVGVFFDQGFLGSAIMVKFCIDGGLSSLRQGRFGSNKVLTVIRKDRRFDFGLR
jgi:hypothetical protein